MTNLLCLHALLAAVSFGQLEITQNQSGTFQALKQGEEGGYNSNDWDGSTILAKNGDVLTTVSTKANRLDLSRPSRTTRTELLMSLYKAGVRRLVRS